MILCINERRHVGGGQTIFDAYVKILVDKRERFDVYEDRLPLHVFSALLKKQYSVVLLNVYSRKYIVLLIVLAILRILVVYPVHGVWFMEEEKIGGKLWLWFTQAVMFLCVYRI